MIDAGLSSGDIKVLARIAGRERATADLLSRSQGQYLDFYFGTLTADEIRFSSEFGVKCSYSALYGASPTATQSQVLTRRLSRLEQNGLFDCCRNPDSPRRRLAKVTRRGHDLMTDREIQPKPIFILPNRLPADRSNLPEWLTDYLTQSTITTPTA